MTCLYFANKVFSVVNFCIHREIAVLWISTACERPGWGQKKGTGKVSYGFTLYYIHLLCRNSTLLKRQRTIFTALEVNVKFGSFKLNEWHPKNASFTHFCFASKITLRNSSTTHWISIIFSQCLCWSLWAVLLCLLPQYSIVQYIIAIFVTLELPTCTVLSSESIWLLTTSHTAWMELKFDRFFFLFFFIPAVYWQLKKLDGKFSCLQSSRHCLLLPTAKGTKWCA